ncbi:MAG TPA: PEP-CTERM sorting domain-containing protein [Candidatus Anammoximicrobium sp.]|nr:PEP-CTERM sorting domain-containing protein [Candidatus Anammoximicrobium sp.]
MQSTRRAVLVGLIALILPAAMAQTLTMVTFADPADDASTPLFTFDGAQFQGGWTGLNLNLLTPGLPLTGDIPDATFTMTTLSATQIVPGYYSLSGGTIEFFDASSVLVFRITFQSASLAPDIGFGASDLALQNVVFYDPAQPTQPFGQDRFAFSFANDAQVGDLSTWTASFTSSAIPEPASMVLLVAGGLLISLRRREA